MSNLRFLSTFLVIPLFLTGCTGSGGPGRSPVSMYEESIVLPTYEVGPADPNPRFYAGRAYQGAEGRVYPYPMLDQLTDEKKEKRYKALYLENEYIRVCILPEIGGRVFEAVDKSNGYDFLYRQHVIKPALIGMLGAWISGGIEWNFPHHHRSRVFMPMDYLLQENPDGSKTVWLSETEIRHGMRFTVGITLYPGRSYFEAEVRPYNQTPFANSFLYWANVAVHANPDYRVIFPPGTEYAVYHGKNQFATWPVSQEIYRGIDYRGVDLSWWKNHPSPLSFFAWNYADDFLAGYDFGQDAGTAYVADHHIAPGKKFWEWGPGPQGRIWDKILTDEDGPYIELMAGAYSDNQPDYSWLQAYEGKRIRQHWYPIRGIGGVKKATLEGAVNLEILNDIATLGFNTTARHRNATALLTAGEDVILEERIDIDPATPFVREVSLPGGLDEQDLRVALFSSGGEVLMEFEPSERAGEPMPDVATPPPPPEEMESVEELYLAGMRLEQFYNPSLEPELYYEEALRRDAGNSRVNTALGVLYMRRGLFEEAEERLRTALRRVTDNHTSPRDGEAFYYLGLTLSLLGRYEQAYKAFYKATWSQAFHSAGFYHVARIDCLRGEFETALEHLDRSIATNAWNLNALNLRSSALRRLGRFEESKEQALAVLAHDPLDMWAQFELYQIASALGSRREIIRARSALETRRAVDTAFWGKGEPWQEAMPWLEAQSFLELASDYSGAGLWEEGIEVLNILVAPGNEEESNPYPMLYYYLGFFSDRMGDEEAASTWYRRAAGMAPSFCFPSRLESIEILRSASRRNPGDALARYYLGNLLYDHQPEAAIMEWERAKELGSGFATLHRNLAWAYTRIENDIPKAIMSMEKALESDRHDPRLYYELDLLYETGGLSPERRFALLEENHPIIAGHNDAFSREIVLLTQLGRYDEAIEYMKVNHFRKWEGIGNIHTTWIDAHLLRGGEHVAAGRWNEAISDYESALEYPENLEVAESYSGGRACQIYFLLGTAYEASPDPARAREYYLEAASASRSAGRGVLDYYQGMAYRKLGDRGRATALFDGLIAFTEGRLESLRSGSSVEFFAKFGSRRSLNEQRADAHYLLGLGYLGRGNDADAREEFESALSLNRNHMWAAAQLSGLR